MVHHLSNVRKQHINMGTISEVQHLPNLREKYSVMNVCVLHKLLNFLEKHAVMNVCLVHNLPRQKDQHVIADMRCVITTALMEGNNMPSWVSDVWSLPP